MTDDDMNAIDAIVNQRLKDSRRKIEKALYWFEQYADALRAAAAFPDRLEGWPRWARERARWFDTRAAMIAKKLSDQGPEE